MSDLFSASQKKPPRKGENKGDSYDASAIEVLEGLEPVRRRPGMYIGGTDDRAFHHLASEILDNAMDEAVAGHATRIEINLSGDGSLTIADNGRGIPTDPHPKFPNKSALEVIMTTLHSGGKFSGKAYETSGGLHGVGISVVNALSDWMWVEVARDRQLVKQSFSRGKAKGKLEKIGPTNKRGTTVCFHPDPDIFGTKMCFKPSWLYKLARSKAYLFKGVEIRWACDSSMLEDDSKVPMQDSFRFPNGLLDYLPTVLEGRAILTPQAFYIAGDIPGGQGKIEAVIAWPEDGEGFSSTYCNTIPTPQGGTHEQGLRNAVSRALRQYGDMVGNKKASLITAEDAIGSACVLLSVFIRDPQFQGQTKEKLATLEATKFVDAALRDHLDHWLTSNPAAAKHLIDTLIERAEERQRSKDDKLMARKSATRKLRLPGKLADCARQDSAGTELFIVEGDSAGGSAKQARNRETQAILPLRGKILNVVSATADKIRANQEIQDLILAMGCGAGKDFKLNNLRYERIIIMTDADVDGAHIASLLMTFFYTQTKALIENGNLYLALPPLYRLTSGNLSVYARDDAHKAELLTTVFKGKSKVDVSRFKGLGEMPAAQLKETTMSEKSRSLIRISLHHAKNAYNLMQHEPQNDDLDDLVERLMGKNADARFAFIQNNANFVEDIDI